MTRSTPLSPSPTPDDVAAARRAVGDRLRLGTRRSALARAQSGTVARNLEAAHPGLTVELVTMDTLGDRTPGSLAPLGGKGLFTEELEAKLLDGGLDLAVHSLKDLPVELPEGLAVAAFPRRADPRDVMVSEVAERPEDLPAGAVVLTGALRRRAQLLALHPELAVTDLRGNVDTRLRKWREAGAEGLILAAAGLERLGIENVPAHPLDPEVFVPAPGQGTLALETRADSPAALLCRAVDHPPTARAARAERAVVAAFGGHCALPLAAWARPAATDDPGGGDERLRLSALVATPDGDRVARADVEADGPSAAAAAAVAALEERDARAILDAVGPPP